MSTIFSMFFKNFCRSLNSRFSPVFYRRLTRVMHADSGGEVYLIYQIYKRMSRLFCKQENILLLNFSHFLFAFSGLFLKAFIYIIYFINIYCIRLNYPTLSVDFQSRLICKTKLLQIFLIKNIKFEYYRKNKSHISGLRFFIYKIG